MIVTESCENGLLGGFKMLLLLEHSVVTNTGTLCYYK